jgi:hypothetical protein
MTLTGSYVDATEAETYFENSPLAITFLDSEYLEWYLQEATRHIDQLTLAGQKYDPDIVAGVAVQALQFPRIIDGVTCDWNDSTDLPVVPQAVKDACLEEALAIFSQGAGGRRDLQEQGVASYQIPGIISETFRPGAGSAAQMGLKSSSAYRFLSKYIARSVPIR